MGILKEMNQKRFCCLLQGQHGLSLPIEVHTTSEFNTYFSCQVAEGGSSLTTDVCSSQEFGSPSEPNVSGEQVDGRKCLSMGPARRQREPGSRCASLGLRAYRSVSAGPWQALRVVDPRLLLGLPGPEAEAGVQVRASSALAACPGWVAFKLPAPPWIHSTKIFKWVKDLNRYLTKNGIRQQIST